MAQEHSLDIFQIHRIVSLLARTNMTFNQIGEQLKCSSAVVAAVNRQYDVRYVGDNGESDLAAPTLLRTMR